ncbi:plasmid mobilization protein [Glacieibacterium frigidum]|uniref:Uncharacterized protein n=1 Tax=Glacieibacterium frigidum TaxID=2593303 RepID=A0A552UFD7_9SPHN|nr:hypothetical protein [Glacieibacterium frigidum]TRW16936.1 hypothetical protein FMM06_01635 [Glacieibacterium frigidum]
MAATERVVVLFEPAEKRALQSRAAAASLSMGEFIKRAVIGAEASPNADQQAELEVLATELEKAVVRMSDRLDTTIARVDATLDPGRDAERRARIEAEVAGLDLSGVAALLGRAA